MRNTDLQSAYFPVELRPLYFFDGEPTLFGEGQWRSAGSFQVVVDVERARALGVVSEGYQLITNKEAVEWGRRSFATLVPSVDSQGLVPFNIRMPSTRSSCVIDLLHPSYEVEAFRHDIYLPFIRITNSYNRSRALLLTLGFIRKLCLNGVIFDSETVTYSFHHTDEGIRRLHRGVSQTEGSRMEKLVKEFKRYMLRLRDHHVPTDYQLPLMATVLELDFKLDHPNERRRLRERERFEEFRAAAKTLLARYGRESGENAYSVFNALTEYTTDPGAKHLSQVQILAMQRRVGRWMTAFPLLVEKPDFSLDRYTARMAAYFN